MSDTESRVGYAQALVAVLLFSSSPVLIRWASRISSMEITFWRLLLATLTVMVLAWLTRRPVVWRTLPHRRFALYGLVVALHFFLYVSSVFFTTVTHALTLVYTAPLFIALLSRLVLHETLRPRQWAGVALGVAGVGVLAGFDPVLRPGALLGDLLALGSAIAFAIYSVAGRAGRAAYRLFDYAAGVYGWGALWLLPLAAWLVPSSHYDLAGGASVLLLGVGPLGAGHTLYNASLRRIPATSANLIATLEVAGGVLLSALALGEIPGLASLAGAAVVVAGILLVIV